MGIAYSPAELIRVSAVMHVSSSVSGERVQIS